MLTITDELKSALRADGNSLEAYITDGTDIIDAGDDLVELALTSEGSIGKTVMRELSGRWNGTYDFLDKYITAFIGGYISDSSLVGTATLTIATPCVVTLVGHGMNTGDKIRFTTTGALPTGLAIDTDVEASDKDVLAGGGFTKPTGVYDMIVDTAYMGKSQKGAVSLNLILKSAQSGDNTTFRQTLWVASGDAKGNKNYYVDKNNKKRLQKWELL